jgi:hypothetical protein
MSRTPMCSTAVCPRSSRTTRRRYARGRPLS